MQLEELVNQYYDDLNENDLILERKTSKGMQTIKKSAVKYLLMNYLNVVTYHGQQFQDLAKRYLLRDFVNLRCV